MKRDLMGYGIVIGVFMMLFMLAVWVGAAQAETCIKMLPFDDVLEIEPTSPVPGLFVVPGDWVGLTSYTLTGGGEATIQRDGTRASLHMTLHNPTAFFGANRVCNLSASILLSNWSGDWSLMCEPTSQSDPVYVQAGTIALATCGASPAMTFGDTPAHLAGQTPAQP
jgi:hypothetical protein